MGNPIHQHLRSANELCYVYLSRRFKVKSPCISLYRCFNRPKTIREIGIIPKV